ncbi:MAG TPA: HD domain-containing phosphohydrolase [Vicinamibacteria bacterium]|nr:HD domain-containing phosphohydrolase [Vicinamibacteria bacterium]
MTDTRKSQILVVDDGAENREILVDLLGSEGYIVDTAKDGAEAVEKALASPPDLILMDVSMPRLTGFEACRRLKADERTHLVPIVLVTGLVAREDRIQGIAAGCDDFLTKPVDSEQLMARTRNLLRTKSLVDELEQAENVLVSLANALDAKDNYTRGHSERVARYAEALGAVVGLGRLECRNLRRAGLLHDIGKIGTSLDYLHKPGPLTTAEYEEVKKHPVIGFEICRPLRTMAPLLELIRGHHERLDGRGYPDALRGDAVPVSLRCLTIADVYDAITSDRSYRKAIPRDRAFKMMSEEASTGMWDARLVDLFFDKVQHLA